MRSFNSKQLRRELDNAMPEKIYLFLGEEAGEKEKIFEVIIKKIFKEEGDINNSTGKFNVETYDDLVQAADFAMSQTMFSSNKLCFIHILDNLKKSKKIAMLLNDMIDTLPDSTTLILSTDKFKAPDIIENEVLKKIKAVHFWRFFDNELAGYINSNLRKAGLEIGTRAVEKLIELTGRDIKKLDEAIETIRYYCEDKTVAIEMIESLVMDSADSTIFEFIDSLYLKERKSLILLKKILDKRVPDLLILSNIIRQAERLERYHRLIEEGASAGSALKNCGIYEKNRNRFLKMTELYSPEKIKEIFPKFSRADYSIKSRGKSNKMITNQIFNLAEEILTGS